MKRFRRIALSSLTLLAAVPVMGATTSAIYLHHQRADLASLEADLQNREIGLDFADKNAVGKFADGTKFHLLSQEMPNAALTGTLNVSGNTTLGAALTLSALTANQPLWTNGSTQASTNAPTGSGTTLVLQTSPTIVNPTVTGTLAGAAGTFSSTLGVTGAATLFSTLGVAGVTTFTAAPVFSSAAASQFLLLDGSKALTSVAGTGSGSVVRANSPTLLSPILNGTVGTALSFSSTVVTDASGNLSTVGNTGSGLYVRATSPTLTTPNIGAATGTSLNLTGNLTADSLVSSKFYTEGTFAAALNGFSACSIGSFGSGACSGTASYTRLGKMVILFVPPLVGTSNSISMYLTGFPAGISPSKSMTLGVYPQMQDNGSTVRGSARLASSPEIDFYKSTDAGTANWTSSGTKGLPEALVFTYTLQ